MPLKRFYQAVRSNIRPGRYGRSLSLSLMQSLIETGCLTVAVLVTARLFGPELFGQLGIYLIGVQFVSTLGDGLLASQVKSVSEKSVSGEQAGSRIGWISAVAISSAAAVLSFLLVGLFVLVQPQRLELDSSILLLAGVAAATRVAKTSMESAYRGLHNFGVPLKIAAVIAVIQAAVLVGAAALGYRIAAYLGIMTCFQLVNAGVLAVLYLRRYRVGVGAFQAGERTEVARMFRYSSMLVLRGMVTFCSLRANVLLIAYFSTERDAGNYRLAEQFLNLVMLVFSAMLGPFAPKVSEFCKRSDHARLQDLTSKVQGVLLMLAVPVAALLLLNAPVVSRLFPEYASATAMIAVFSVLPLAFAISYPFAIVLVQGGKAHLAFVITLCAGILNLLLVSILAQSYGGRGAVWGATGVHLMIAIATTTLAALHFNLKVRPDLRFTRTGSPA